MSKNQRIVANTSQNNYVKLKNLVYQRLVISIKTNRLCILNDICLTGYCPTQISNVKIGSELEMNGLNKGDLLIEINGVNCYRATMKTIMNMIKPINGILSLTVYKRLKNPETAFKMSKLLNDEKFVVIKPIVNKKINSKNKNIISKLLKPSLWLSCAQPTNTTMSSILMEQSDTEYKQNICSSIKTGEYVLCERECCHLSDKITKCECGADTGYETLSRYNESSVKTNQLIIDSNLSITTVTNTTNSYSECDLTVESRHKDKLKSTMNYESMKMDKFNQIRTQLIGNLIEIEANFVSYLSLSVATFSRPLRGFFIQQQDYFTLFQNIEKILVISENFLRSMDKWSAYDLYTKIGQLYTQKMSLFKEAFSTYVKGYAKAKSLLSELVSHSKQFRLFLNETQSAKLTLANLIDLPIVHMQKTMDLFKQIKMYTMDSKPSPSEAPHIDSVIVELKKILNIIDSNEIKFNQVFYDELMFSKLDESQNSFITFFNESLSTCIKYINFDSTGSSDLSDESL